MSPRRDGTQVRPPQASAWNIANALTLSRLALVPVFAWFLLRDGGTSTNHRLIAAAVFLVATATDHIDGAIARAKGLVTDFGKVSDPIADKALMGMALVGLSMLGLLSWWVTALVLFREVGITVVRLVVIRHGVMPASRGGKVKTVLQAIAILLYVLPLSAAWHSIAVAVMAAAVLVTVATGVDYVMRAQILRNTSPRALAKRRRRAAEAREAGAAEAAGSGGAGSGVAASRAEAAGDGVAGGDEAEAQARHTARPEV